MIYIQGVTGLQPISSQLTKEKIIAALGYTPADQNTFWEDESGALVVADQAGYIIARIDADGFTSTKVSAKAIQLDGEDLAVKLKSLEEKVPEIDLSDYATEKYVDDALANLDIDIPEVDLSALDSHLDDADVHVTAEDKEAWDAKSNFSGNYSDLENAPHIVNDNEDEVVICDSQGNVILRATAEGLNVAAVYVNGEKVLSGPSTFYIRYDSDEQPTPMTFLPGMNFKDWANSNYCPSTVAYDSSAKYYRVANSLAILEDFDDYNTAAVEITTLYEGKTFYCRADGV